jgi:hypothetical protein
MWSAEMHGITERAVDDLLAVSLSLFPLRPRHAFLCVGLMGNAISLSRAGSLLLEEAVGLVADLAWSGVQKV